MIKAKKKLIVCFVLIFSSSLLGCANMAPDATTDVPPEIWQLEFSGQTRGHLEMTMRRVELQAGIYSVTGKIIGEVVDHLGGAGKVDFTIKGSVKKGVLKSSLNGDAAVAEGLSSTDGTLQGTISDVEGAGTWTIMHTLGSSSGNYTMKRANNSGK